MIKGFENILTPLNERDKELAKMMKEAFELRPKGKMNRIKAPAIIAGFAKKGIKIDDIKVRQLTHYLRVNDLLIGLCSNSHGYWMCDTPQELIDTLTSLNDRIREQLGTYNALKRQYVKLFGKNEKGEATCKPLV